MEDEHILTALIFSSQYFFSCRRWKHSGGPWGQSIAFRHREKGIGHRYGAILWEGLWTVEEQKRDPSSCDWPVQSPCCPLCTQYLVNFIIFRCSTYENRHRNVCISCVSGMFEGHGNPQTLYGHSHRTPRRDHRQHCSRNRLRNWTAQFDLRETRCQICDQCMTFCRYFTFFFTTIDSPIGSTIDWLIDWLIGVIDWLILPLIDWLIDSTIDWLIDWFYHRLIDWLIDWFSHEEVFLFCFFRFSNLYWPPFAGGFNSIRRRGRKGCCWKWVCRWYSGREKKLSSFRHLLSKTLTIPNVFLPCSQLSSLFLHWRKRRSVWTRQKEESVWLCPIGSVWDSSKAISLRRSSTLVRRWKWVGKEFQSAFLTFSIQNFI